MLSQEFVWLYGAVASVVVGWHVMGRHRRRRSDAEALQESQRAGLNEPANLHPVVDPDRCFGSGACAKACPEGALGIVDGKATLINASACIGHGACATACPSQALSLVFGTARRGVDIPILSPSFESSVDGLFVAGELGGMGLIRKTTEQGHQAMLAISERLKTSGGEAEWDVVIVGAGPAGISAGLTAIQQGLRYVIVEQEAALGGAVYHYPRNKIAMTAPVNLAVVGKMSLGTEVPKEKLLAFWEDVSRKTRLNVLFDARMESVDRQADGTFMVATSGGRMTARAVLLAMGRRGTPRKLGVDGEEQAKVVYRLIDAVQYRGQRVLVVGGGDSALEAALALSEVPGVVASVSYRGDAFSRVKSRNRERLVAAERAGQIQVFLGTEVQEIRQACVMLGGAEGAIQLDNDAVIVCAGGVLPTGVLQAMGVRFDTKYGAA